MRIFIACADKTFRLALLWLLENEPGMVVIGMTDSAEGLPVILGATQPEVLLYDYDLTRAATTNLIGNLLRPGAATQNRCLVTRPASKHGRQVSRR